MCTEKRWRKADIEDEFFCCPGHADKEIYYARTYTPGKGFSHSETNNLISNFRKGKKASSACLYYRGLAIQQFVTEVSDFLKTGARGARKFLLIPMPCSKHRAHSDYDDRIDVVAKKVAELCDNVRFFPVLHAADMPTFHTSTVTRSWQQIYRVLRIDPGISGTIEKDRTLLVLDDVTTSGAHFEGARVLLNETFPENDVMGIFWAKSKA